MGYDALIVDCPTPVGTVRLVPARVTQAAILADSAEAVNFSDEGSEMLNMPCACSFRSRRIARSGGLGPDLAIRAEQLSISRLTALHIENY